jgi:hypothetical protein
MARPCLSISSAIQGGAALTLSSTRQRKIHNYVSFAIDGPMTATFPEADGLAWQIVIDCQSGLPDEHTRAVLSQVGRAVRGYGGDLVVR